MVCIYAMIGAWIFYSLESPHEDRVNTNFIFFVKFKKILVKNNWRSTDLSNEA